MAGRSYVDFANPLSIYGVWKIWRVEYIRILGMLLIHSIVEQVVHISPSGFRFTAADSGLRVIDKASYSPLGAKPIAAAHTFTKIFLLDIS